MIKSEAITRFFRQISSKYLIKFEEEIELKTLTNTKPL